MQVISEHNNDKDTTTINNFILDPWHCLCAHKEIHDNINIENIVKK
jgi:hypothetical protein